LADEGRYISVTFHFLHSALELPSVRLLVCGEQFKIIGG
jgi:hypothetical protein